MNTVGLLLATLGIIVLIISAAGIIRLPDALARQHAATKAATLAITIVSAGLLFVSIGSGWGWQWTLRIIVMVLLLLITLPLASHALARAAIAEGTDQES